MLELHCHTTFSDGTLTPTQLVQQAIAAGVTGLAVTDHDTIAGWDEAFQAAQDTTVEIVPGLELSTVWGGRSLHILGYYPNPTQLLEPLTERVNGRKRRAQAMADKLADLGYPITLPQDFGAMAPGRPLIAKALVQAGYVSRPQEAFERWLGEDGPAYVAYEKFTAIAGIELLRQCGAVPVWAHPFLWRGGSVEATLPTLVEAGLLGVEVYHPSHTPRDQRRLLAWCDRYDLIATGGTDYHGPNPETRLNQYHLPQDLLIELQERHALLSA